MTERPLEVRPIGVVESPLTDRSSAPKQGHEGAPDAWLVIHPTCKPGSRACTSAIASSSSRGSIGPTATCCACDPRDDRTRPEQGVFGTRSPDRPNPIGLHPVEILAIERNRLHVRDLEALDGTPIVDIKPVLGREFDRGD